MPVRALTPVPEGWSLTTTPTASRVGGIERDELPFNSETIHVRYTALCEWATTNGLQLATVQSAPIQYTDWAELYAYTAFSLTRAETPDNGRLFAAYDCPVCQRALQIGQLFCTNCENFQVCAQCRIAGTRLHGLTGMRGGYCSTCCRTCATEGCENLYGGDYTRCESCEPREACTSCSTVVSSGEIQVAPYSGGSHRICAACVVRFVCQECSSYAARGVNEVNIGDETRRMCTECAQRIYDSQRAQFESWSEDEMPVSGSLVIPSSPARPTRTISIETEFDGHGGHVGRALYSAGLLGHPERDRYSTAGRAEERFPCILKSDGTVSGGELVSYLLDMDNPNHAAALLRMTEVMRGCRELGQARFSSNAGGHIHIDMHGYSLQDMWSKYTILKFLEMPIYYIGGAGASYGHRSLQGNGYGGAPEGGPFGSLKNFYAKVNKGRTGFNIGSYLHAGREMCGCGAINIGHWEDCSCNLGKATTEWRVWNSEITPRILHAWIALMQSVTAFAQETVCNEEEFPYMVWTRRNFGDLSLADVEAIKMRLEWMHVNLPLTPHERDSLVYACKKSQLIDLGEEYLTGLTDIENVSEFAVKKGARNPNGRKVDFALAPAGEPISVAEAADGYDVSPEYYDEDESDDDGSW